MRRLTLAVLLDAFRPDYLRHAPFLTELACGAPAKLREPFGFLPRAAYFGGLSPEELGYSNMYARDPERSPFGVARGLGGRRLEPNANRLGLRPFVDGVARSRVDRFARSYVSSAGIPLDLAGEFTLVEQVAPWDRRAGYRSIFHEIEDAGDRWFECSWPGTNDLQDHSDKGIVAAALTRATGRERFGYVHLQELDGVGHQFGPGSRQVRESIEATDARVADLVNGLRGRFERVDVVVFGDHGMVPVTRAIDLGVALAELPCRAPVDFTYFLDSTMARFWFQSARAESAVRRLLSSMDGGHVLTAAEMERFRIAGCNPGNGALIFLADPGVVIHPNFFQRSGDLPRGMHGYDPDCSDNLGILICRSDLVDPPSGIVDATDLHPLFRRLTGLEPSVRDKKRVSSRTPSRFTRVPSRQADLAVAAHLEKITSTIVETLGMPRAIVLTGSFGRGEGGVFSDGEVYRPVNDYDVLVVDETDRSWALHEIGADLPRKLGIDFLDLAWADGGFRYCPPTIANFDLKYGSTVLLGDPTVLDALPAYASRDIPLIEGVQLLLNRTAGLLSGMSGVQPAIENGRDRDRRYLINQYVKAAAAIGDTYLLEWGCYDSSYAARRQRFRELAPGVGIATAVVARIVEAYTLKMEPDYASLGDVNAQIRVLTPLLLGRLCEAISACAGRGTVLSLDGALGAYLELTKSDGQDRDDRQLLQEHAVAAIAMPHGAASVRQAIYATLPLLLEAAAADDGPRCQTADWRSAGRLRLPAHVNGWLEWEALAAKVVSAWFATIH